MWQTLRIAMPIFQYDFPGCQALFAFYNASNYCCFAPDALLASNISLNPGGKQPRMRGGFDHGRGLPQAMVYSDNHPNLVVRGKPKGAKAVLRERGLWSHDSWRSDGFKFKLECPKNRGGCNPKLDGTTGCCARRVLSQQ